MSWFASWRTGLRIARREARRSKGRSTLVILMIALPVTALAGFASAYDMFELTPAEKVDRVVGGAEHLHRDRAAHGSEDDPRRHHHRDPSRRGEDRAVRRQGDRH